MASRQEEPSEVDKGIVAFLDIGLVSFFETITVWIIALIFLLPWLAWFYIAGNA